MFTPSMANKYLPTHLRGDAPKNEERVRVRVKFHGIGASSFIAGGQLVALPRERDKPVASAPVEVVVYESELSDIEAQVETQLGMLEQARQMYLMDLRAEVIQRGHKVYEVESADVEDWPEQARKWAREMTPLSIESAFHRLTGHGVKPLESFEVVEKLPAPPDEQAVSVARMVAAVRAADGGGSDVDALKAQVRELTALVEKLTKKG
jgi:hypothetical protein